MCNDKVLVFSFHGISVSCILLGCLLPIKCGVCSGSEGIGYVCCSLMYYFKYRAISVDVCVVHV
jgi:hypothetical protein